MDGWLKTVIVWKKSEVGEDNISNFIIELECCEASTSACGQESE